MNISRENIVAVLYESIRELNELRSKDQKLACAPDTPLSEHSGLDSLGFVNLIALIEEKCEQRFGRSLMLSDIDETTTEDPFASVSTLAGFIESRLTEQAVTVREGAR